MLGLTVISQRRVKRCKLDIGMENDLRMGLQSYEDGRNYKTSKKLEIG